MVNKIKIQAIRKRINHIRIFWIAFSFDGLTKYGQFDIFQRLKQKKNTKNKPNTQ